LCFKGIARSFNEVSGPTDWALPDIVVQARRLTRPINGYDTSIAIGYWTSPERFDRWRSSPRAAGWWDAPERLREGVGYFLEILLPEAERFETLFSAPDRLEGVGVAMGARSAEDIQEHAYWGSMRELYLYDMEPVFRAGMDFLRDRGGGAAAAIP
jgi:hypothetical protein